MSKVFVGGSRQISRLSPAVRERLDRIVDKGLHILVGDANGADKAVQRHLQERGYKDVLVYCVGGTYRNNLGNWPLRAVRPPSARKDFSYFAEKDRLMAREADFGLMIWDGKSLGTLLNVSRLVGQQKKVVVYMAHERQAMEIKTESDFTGFLSLCGDDLRRRAMKQVEREEVGSRPVRQAELFR